MPVPSLITDLSQTAASNYPQGSDSPSNLDDTQRAHGSFIALLRDGKGFTNPVTLASAATVDIGGQNSLSAEITGTTTITSFGTTYNGPRFLRFTGALILTHNATTLNLPGASNITTAAGDTAVAIPNSALNGWNVIAFQRASGLPSFPVDVQKLTATLATVGGTATAITATTSPATSGVKQLVLTIATGNGGAATTLAANGDAPKSVKALDATGALVDTTTVAGQGCLFYDMGTYWLLVNALPPAAAIQVPTRQTVISGPVDANGFPNFLPNTSANLNITSQNVSTGVNALVATAAGGANVSGAINVVGQATANLTWTGCTANQTNFLPVSISGGVLTPLTPVILAPIYQFGGSPSVTAGQYTYNIQQGIMYLGNGTTAAAVNHVIVGEAVAGASTITSTVAYAYQRKYASGYANAPQNAGIAVSKNHNCGTTLIKTGYRLRCAVANNNYVVGEIEPAPWTQGGTSNSSVIVPSISSRNAMRVIGGSTLGVGIYDRTTGGGINVSGSTSWDFELWAEGLF